MLGFKTFAESPIASLVVLNDVNVTPTGQVGTGAVGSLGFSLDLNFSVNQSSLTATVGTPTVIADRNLSLTGLSST